MPRISTSTRQHILDTAGDLFFRDGYRAVGVDTIVAESGVGKMTLYRHFASKDELIVAYLRASNQKFWAWFEQALVSAAGNPRQQLIDLFKALEVLVATPACHGCPFLNALVDFPEPDHPGHQVALEHKRAVLARISQIAARAGARSPHELADQLFLLMDGAFMAVRTFGSDNPASNVSAAAQILINAQLSGQAQPDSLRLQSN